MDRYEQKLVTAVQADTETDVAIRQLTKELGCKHVDVEAIAKVFNIDREGKVAYLLAAFTTYINTTP
jgi:hypothetical protein